MNLKDFLLNSVTLRKVGFALATNQPEQYDLFEGKSRYLCLYNALGEIQSDVEKGSLGENTLSFLTELLAKCRLTLDPQLSSKSGTKVPPALRDVEHVTEDDDSMEADTPCKDNSWAAQMEREEKRQKSKPPTKRAPTKKEVAKFAKKSPPLKAKDRVKPKVAAKKAATPVGVKKERLHKARLLVPLDFPTVQDQSLLSDKAFTQDHHGNVIFRERTATLEELSAARQGDWHPLKSCVVCDTFRGYVDYYRKVGNEETAPQNWLVRPNPYEYRLLIIAHAYKLGSSIDFASFTDNYKFLNLDVQRTHPTLESEIISTPNGRRISLPDRLGKTVKEMAVANHRYGLTELKRDTYK